MKYIIPLLFFFLGVVVFYNYADWENIVWTDAYYIWDKTKDVLFIGTIFYLLKNKQVRIICGSIFLFALIRLVWEIISLVTGTDINQKEAINIIFLILLLVWVYPALQIAWQWLKQNS